MLRTTPAAGSAVDIPEFSLLVGLAVRGAAASRVTARFALAVAMLGTVALGMGSLGMAPPMVASASAQESFVLGNGIEIRSDGAAGLLIDWNGESVAQIHLIVWGAIDEVGRAGYAGQPDARGEAEDGPEHRLGLQARTLSRQQSQARGPAPMVRPQPGGGLLVEHRAARLSLPSADPTWLDADLFRWPYFHIDDVVFWNALVWSQAATEQGVEPRVDNQAANQLVAGVAITVTSTNIDVSDIWIRPHPELSNTKPRLVRAPVLVCRDGTGQRLYLAVARLDGRIGQLEGEKGHFAWTADGADRNRASDTGDAELSDRRVWAEWPLAIVTARTRNALEYNLGQALASYVDTGSNNSSINIDMGGVRWAVPALCAACQQAKVASGDLRLEREGEDLLIELSADAVHVGGGHGELDGESLVLGGQPMADWLESDDTVSSHYRLIFDSASAKRVLRAIAASHWTAEATFASGISTNLSQLRLTIGPALLASMPVQTADLPKFLSSDLLGSWPNPFKLETTIQYRVPSTLGEAFEFESEVPAGVDLRSPPPFGGQPRVRIKVYNVSGKLVRILDEGVRSVGEYQIRWDGTNLQGRPVAAGAYYVTVEMGEYRVTRRVLRLQP